MKNEKVQVEGNLSMMSGGGWVYWLMERKKHFSLILPLFIMLSFLGFKFFYTPPATERDFVNANLFLSNWEKNGENDSFLRFMEMRKKHPELSLRYDTRVIQNLIAQSDFARASSMASKALERSAKRVPSYSDFGQTTRLIENESYGEALKEAERLKIEMMEEERGSSSMLYALNLMRIACLNQKLGNFSDELFAWQQLKRLGSSDETPSPLRKEAFDKLVSHFTCQKVTLLDYIQHREEALQSLSLRGRQLTS